MQVSLEMSQILTVESMDPEARTDRLTLLRDREGTGAVCDPGLYFLALFVNFLGFFLLFSVIYPPRMTSG